MPANDVADPGYSARCKRAAKGHMNAALESKWQMHERSRRVGALWTCLARRHGKDWPVAHVAQSKLLYIHSSNVKTQ